MVDSVTRFKATFKSRKFLIGKLKFLLRRKVKSMKGDEVKELIIAKRLFFLKGYF